MTDKFSPTPLVKLLQIILNQYEKQKCIFGIPRELFFTSKADDPFRFYRFGQLLENPIGVAAGPHTQLAQNIVAAWLCGARYIELKTIQTLDNLEISKPCIDMQDEGYNCEWSQELKIRQSFDQYLDAWILIHILKHMFEEKSFSEAGVIFNMSVGYNLEEIKKENVQVFLDKMQDASEELNERVEHIQHIYPGISEISINSCISNNVTLSTMHGCPADEIEKIGLYLINEKNLHTTIKLNPTLLGKEEVHTIMKHSGFDTLVPEHAFEHDLKFNDAVKIIQNLRKAGEEQNLHFGIKLSNTLESINTRDVFPEKEKMMYMSGIPLHPIAIGLAEKLQNEFNGELDISFSAGLDAFNISDVIACGLYPATVCTDILKPGGYGRLHQYIENLRQDFSLYSSSSIEEFVLKSGNNASKSEKEGALNNLWKYSIKVRSNKDYQKRTIKNPSIKTNKELGIFDCIHAPCESTCPTRQGIPDYMYYAAKKDFEGAKKVILETNPFPHVTGKVCDHVCQEKCTRINYDNPLLIRDVKYAISTLSDVKIKSEDKLKQIGKKVSVVGAGPSGLACAYFLSLAGIKVEIYESGEKPGGMANAAIPKFRLDNENLNIDIDSILSLGIKIHYKQRIDKEKFEGLVKGSDYVYIATGAPKSRPFAIDGADSPHVLDPLQFLYDIKSGSASKLGKNVIVIGGGNTAMDAARTAKRIVGSGGKVRIVYRRTIKQMPANEEEIKETMEESIDIIELANPLYINTIENKIHSLTCQKMRLGDKDVSGRRIPVPILNSEFEILCDTIIPAVGQGTDLHFISANLLKTKPGEFETQVPNIFIGGDALNGGVSVIAAIGDGRKVAQIMIDRSEIEYKTKKESIRPQAGYRELMIRKSKRIKAIALNKTNSGQRNNFNLILKPLSADETISEASRCLLCDELCNICITVCPNLALFAYQTNPFKLSGTDGKFLFVPNQKTQILHIADWCNECGNCDTFCPTKGAPYKDKPHLYLNKKAFSQADDAYYFIYTDEEQTLLYKKGSEIHSFAENPINYSYITKGFSAQIKKQSFDIQSIQYRNPDEKIDLVTAVQLKVILEAAKQFFGL